MKKSSKDPEGYYSVSVFAAVVITIAVHYFFISKIDLHPTIHAVIGVGIFFVFSAALSSILSRFW